MATPGFIFGGNTPWTYEKVQRQRQIADALAANMGTPRNVGEGLSAIGKALAFRGITKRADSEESRLKGEFDRTWAGLLGGGAAAPMPGGASDVAGPGEAMPRGVSSRSLDPNDPKNIGDDAMRALGRQPMSHFRDAIASIESDGSGGYSAIGPTDPQLGRALGRYQVMEANIRPWSRQVLGREITPEEFLQNPQLQDAIFDGIFGGYVERFGPEGAAQAWFAGPGGVGKMDRSDVLGTSVADYTQKFTQALGGGGGQPPAPAGGTGMSVQMLAEVAGSPFASPGQKAVAEALLEQQLSPPDPMRAIELERAQLELEQLRNPQPEFATLTPEEEAANGLAPEGVYQRGADGRIVQVGGGGTNVTVNNGGQGGTDWGDPPKDMVWLRGADGQVLTEPDPSGRGVRPVAVPISGGPQDTTSSDVAAANQTAQSGMIVFEDIGRLKAMLTGGRMQPITGPLGALAANVPGSEASDARAMAQTLRANIGFDRLQAMREASPTGGALGNVTERELSDLQAVLGSLEFSQSKEQLLSNLTRLEDMYARILEEAGRSGDGSLVPRGWTRDQGLPGRGDASAQPATPQRRLRFNPATGDLE